MLGIILAFKHWPLTPKQQKIILKTTASAGLTHQTNYAFLKTQVFKWHSTKAPLTISSAHKICDLFKSLIFIKYCEPDTRITPAFASPPKAPPVRPAYNPSPRTRLTNTLNKQNNQPKIQNNKAKDLPMPMQGKSKKTKTQNIRVCGDVSSKLNLHKGELSDYWAQRRIGADLLKEMLKFQPPPKKHLVAVFDSDTRSHSQGVKNLISDEGPHAVLPDIEDSLSVFNGDYVSWTAANANYLHQEVERKCGDLLPPKPKPIEVEHEDYGGIQ